MIQMVTSIMFNADEMLARLPHERAADVQAELDHKSAEHDDHYTAAERANLLGIGDGW